MMEVLTGKVNMTTLQDIARDTGLSTRTVSRVIKKNGYVSKPALEKVKKSIDKLEYMPNIFAQALKTKKTGLIGIISYAMSFQVMTKLLDCIQKQSQKMGYNTLLTIADEDNVETEALKSYVKLCDLIIFLRHPGKASIDLLTKMKIPYLMVKNPAYPPLWIDRSKGISEMIQQHDNNFSKYIHLGPIPVSSEQKWIFFKSNLKGKDILFVELSDENFKGGYKAGDEIFKYKNSLIYCYSDRIAMGLMQRLSELNAKIPEEYSITGNDNDDFSKYIYKSLSTINMPLEELAKRTIYFADSILKGNKIPKLEPLQTHFIKRASTR